MKMIIGDLPGKVCPCTWLFHELLSAHLHSFRPRCQAQYT